MRNKAFNETHFQKHYGQCFEAFHSQIGITSEYSTEIKESAHYEEIVKNELYFKRIEEQ